MIVYFSITSVFLKSYRLVYLYVFIVYIHYAYPFSSVIYLPRQNIGLSLRPLQTRIYSHRKVCFLHTRIFPSSYSLSISVMCSAEAPGTLSSTIFCISSLLRTSPPFLSSDVPAPDPPPHEMSDTQDQSQHHKQRKDF